MPKVSEDHLERRRRQILEAAGRCFARKGFHDTSLQDIFRESGLSAGAVYRYFKSKDELVQAIGAEVFDHLSAALDAVLSTEPIPGVEEVVGSLASAAQDMGGGEAELVRLAPLAWAEALHDPTMAETVRQNMRGLQGQMSKWLTRLRDDGRLDAESDVVALGGVLIALLPGYLVVHLLVGDLDVTTLELGLAQLLRPELLGKPAAPGTPSPKKRTSSR
jgi:TetR/AcrR family transcriptional regulator, transcriptional repressor of aconitase